MALASEQKSPEARTGLFLGLLLFVSLSHGLCRFFGKAVLPDFPGLPRPLLFSLFPGLGHDPVQVSGVLPRGLPDLPPCVHGFASIHSISPPSLSRVPLRVMMIRVTSLVTSAALKDEPEQVQGSGKKVP